ncbi:MAG: universal stress protein [Spongiibacteraceae bacterium]|jgi:universal stress protein A|nr:universal stress protein [Spongiibacteraceae bacterium]
MNNYNTILVAVDLTAEAEQVMARAAAVAGQNGTSNLHVVHVIEPLSFAYGGDIPIDFSAIQDEIQKQAESHLRTLCEKYGVAAEHQHLVTGSPEKEIQALAEELGTDLVVLGSHGRHGFGLLLMGSTANGILHGAKMDVLAVRVGT